MNIICDILANETLTQDYPVYAMTLYAPEVAQTAKPGQFIHIQCGDLTLRRPISIASVQNERIKICYEVRGEGTAWLAGLKSGEKADIMGPIGKGFDVSDLSKKVLLAGGGIGIYPLYSVAQAYGKNAHVSLGFRTKGAVNFEREFAGTGCNLRIATDDGSYGKKGFVTESVKDILEHHKDKFDIIMTCGPKKMMYSIYAEAEKRGIRCQVSMEERMACGIGACLVCVCKINGKNERVCVDGPVFEGNEVDWSE